MAWSSGGNQLLELTHTFLAIPPHVRNTPPFVHSSADVTRFEDAEPIKLYLHPEQVKTAVLRSSRDNVDFLPTNRAQAWTFFQVAKENEGVLTSLLNTRVTANAVSGKGKWRACLSCSCLPHLAHILTARPSCAIVGPRRLPISKMRQQ